MRTLQKVYRLLLRWQNIIAGILSVVFVGIFVYVLHIHVPDFIVHHEQFMARFDDLRLLVESFEVLALPIFVLVFFLANSLFVPLFILGVLGGMIFDPFTASFLGLVGLALSMQTYYWLAKWLGRGFSRWFSSGEVLKLNDSHKKMGYKSLLCLRFNFFVPLHPVNAICGGLNVPFRKFLTATVLGLSPRVVVYCALGAGLVRGGRRLHWTVALWLLLIIVQSIFGFWHLKTFTARRSKNFGELEDN